MQYDAIVIGGSFAGLSAALQLARARRTVCVIDAGQPRNRFAEASHGFFGQDGDAPLTMIARARQQLESYPTVRTPVPPKRRTRSTAASRFPSAARFYMRSNLC
jgi:thioredoxin reductase